MINSIVAGCIASVGVNAVATTSDESIRRLHELHARLMHVLTTDVRSASARAALWPHVKKLDAPEDERACSGEAARDTSALWEFFSNVILIVESKELDEADMYDVGTVAGYAAEFMPWTAWRLVEEFCHVTANYQRVTASQIICMAVAHEKLMPCPRYYRRRVLTDYPALWRSDAYEPPHVPPAWFMQSLLETVRRLEIHQDTQGAQLIWGPLANMLDDYYIQQPPQALGELLATESSAWITQRILIALTYHPTLEALALYEKYYACAYPDSSQRDRRREIAQFRERVEQHEARQRSYTGSITSEVQAVAAFKQQQAAWDAKLNAMALRTPDEADAFEAALLHYEALCRDAGRSDWFRPENYTSRLNTAPVPALKEWYWRALTQCMHQAELRLSPVAVTLSAGAAFGAVLEEADFDRLISLNNALGTWDVVKRKNARDEDQDGEWRGVTKLAVLSAFSGLAASGRTNVVAALAQRRMQIHDRQVRDVLDQFAKSAAPSNQ